MPSEREIEELTLNAWPPLETLLFDGWILGFAEGYTRRANSIHPLYPSTFALSEKIALCEAAYAARGREVTFKITSSPLDADLDSMLDRHSYAPVAQTSVQTTDLAGWRVEDDPDVVVSTELDERWFTEFNRLSVIPRRLQEAERRLLEKIGPPHAYGSVTINEQAVAVGLAVAERGHVGLFDIVVDPGVRNQGLGRRLCARLLEWGRDEHGAGTGYLAVMSDNAPALKLYANLGFREVYTYWYRQAARAG